MEKSWSQAWDDINKVYDDLNRISDIKENIIIFVDFFRNVLFPHVLIYES